MLQAEEPPQTVPISFGTAARPSLVPSAASEQLENVRNRIATWRNVVAADVTVLPISPRRDASDPGGEEVLRLQRKEASSWIHFATSGSFPIVLVNEVQSERFATRPSVGLVLAAFLAGAAIWAAGNLRFVGWIQTNPHFAVFAAGIMWLLWLRPAWFGYVVIILGAWLWLQKAVRRDHPKV
jgi:hypothetical protein